MVLVGILASFPRGKEGLGGMEKGRDNDKLPHDSTAEQVKDEPGPSGICDEDVWGVADAGSLDGADGQEPADKSEDGGHDGDAAQRVEGDMEEADQVAQRRAQDRDAAEQRQGSVRVALGPEQSGVDVGVDEERDDGGDGEQDGDDEEDAEGELVDEGHDDDDEMVAGGRAAWM